jgi:hypothetical protein
LDHDECHRPENAANPHGHHSHMPYVSLRPWELSPRPSPR